MIDHSERRAVLSFMAIGLLGSSSTAVRASEENRGASTPSANPLPPMMSKGVSVREFGAIGDGKADDSKAIQQAIDSGASVLIFPSGLYRLSEGLRFAASQAYISAGHAIIEGAPRRKLRNGIPAGSRGIIFDGIEFRNFDQPLSHIPDTAKRPISDLTVRNCVFRDCNQGLHFPWFANNVRIENNLFENVTRDGSTSAIQFGKQENERRGSDLAQGPYFISGNVIDMVRNTSRDRADTHGIILRGFSAFVTHNIIRNITSAATEGTGCEGVYLVTSFAKVSGNTFWNAGNREASLVLKGGFDDGRIPKGSSGYSNIISNNSFYSDEENSTALFSNADNNLIIGNIFEGFGESGIKSTVNGNSTHIVANYFIRFSGAVCIKSSDGMLHAYGNVIESPRGRGGTFYAFYITATKEEAQNIYLANNHIIIGDQLTAKEAYGAFLAARAAPMRNIYIDNRLIVEGSETRVYGCGIDMDGFPITDVRVGGIMRGEMAEFVRYLRGRPDNVRLEIDIEEPRSRAGEMRLQRGESGRTITDAVAPALGTIFLPPAEPNLSFTMIRTQSQPLRVVPDGGDKIRGGGVGEGMRLDAEGASLTLQCVIAGTWEILRAQGPIARND